MAQMAFRLCVLSQLWSSLTYNLSGEKLCWTFRKRCPKSSSFNYCENCFLHQRSRFSSCRVIFDSSFLAHRYVIVFPWMLKTRRIRSHLKHMVFAQRTLLILLGCVCSFAASRLCFSIESIWQLSTFSFGCSHLKSRSFQKLETHRIT